MRARGEIMGRTIFICVVNTKEQFEKAMRCVFTHNTTPMVKTGERYTDEEFRTLDPMRFATMTMIRERFSGDGTLVAGVQERWNRGENILAGGIFVRFQGDLWLEVKNEGGGICTTLFLKNHAPDLGWIGTEGKPQGFYDAPAVGSASTFPQLAELHATLI